MCARVRVRVCACERARPRAHARARSCVYVCLYVVVCRCMWVWAWVWVCVCVCGGGCGWRCVRGRAITFQPVVRSHTQDRGSPVSLAAAVSVVFSVCDFCDACGRALLDK